MNVADETTVDLERSRAGPSRFQGGIGPRFDFNRPLFAGHAFQDESDLIIDLTEDGMDRWIAVDRQMGIFLRPIEPRALAS